MLSVDLGNEWGLMDPRSSERCGWGRVWRVHIRGDRAVELAAAQASTQRCTACQATSAFQMLTAYAYTTPTVLDVVTASHLHRTPLHLAFEARRCQSASYSGP